MAQGVQQSALTITEAVLRPLPDNQTQQQFTAVISGSFNGLLLAEALADSEANYLVRLTFDPQAIATFLTELDGKLGANPVAHRSLKQAIQRLQPNDSEIQAAFTLHLVEALTSSSSDLPSADAACDHLVAAALRQQVEQERLVNHVTSQIRQSIDLTFILQTTIQQVQQLLQVDRVVIYEFAPLETSADSSELKQAPAQNGKKPLVYGRVTYEAIATESIPSVLHLAEENYCFAELPNYQDKYFKGCILAISDVAATYALSPCLLDLLQRAWVRAKLLVPIVVEETLWGLLIAHQCETPRQWQDSDQVFLQRVAEHLAIAIYQAKLYSQLQQQREMLELRVVERTQELRDALVAAQTASQAKTEFLAAMSHELRTPLTCVIGMAETLLRALSSPANYAFQPQKQQDYLKIIKRSGEHLLELINDILDMSQVEAGKMVLTISEFSLSQLARQCLQNLSEKARSNGVNLRLDLQLNSGMTNGHTVADDRFMADHRRIGQILLNLLSNAIKFTPQGGQVILRVIANADHAVFQVEDTGIGISDSQRPLLFQKFQQLDGSFQRRYEGVGLGLALTRQLVELHGGVIEVESVVGEGSTFTVRIPAQPLSKLRDRSDATVPEAVITRLDQADPSFVEEIASVGRRVVLIEDQDDTAMLICDLLTAAGFQVVWMVEGATAVKQIEILQPALVITDIQLPSIDGYEVIRFVRRQPALLHTRILAIGHLALQARDRCLQEGADDYLTKPIDPYQLLDKISLMLTGNGYRETAKLAQE